MEPGTRNPIPIYQPEIGPEELENVQDAVRSGWVSSKGPFIGRFEAGFSQYIGCKHGISTCNGTAALHLALRSLNIGPGDEVIVPDLTFVAPVNAVLYSGATPVLVDVEEEGWGADMLNVERAITSRTKAIILVHLYGNPARADRFAELCSQRELLLIEDAAEAHGATCGRRKVGSFGKVSCFSFYGNKILTTGEGGMCLTDDSALADRMLMLRDHGMKPARRYWHDEVGFNYRMTNLQAAVGVAQLAKIDSIIRRKHEIARLYSQLLSGSVIVQTSPSWGDSVFWLYSILTRDTKVRDGLSRFLSSQGIETRAFFYPVHEMPPYVKFAARGQYPVSSRLSSTGINLPSYPRLNDDDVVYIAHRLLSYLTDVG